MTDTNEGLLENLLNAARELAGYASYAEIVGGVSVNRPQVRQWCDAVFAAVRALPEDEDFEPSVKEWVTCAGRDAHVAAELARVTAERDALREAAASYQAALVAQGIDGSKGPKQ